MGDALSHTSLLGVVLAFLFAASLRASGVIGEDGYTAVQHAIMFAGAMLVGVLSAVLTEGIQKLGRVEASASLGVVFTIVFAVGLLLIRVAADSVHIDPDCVLYGELETAVVGRGVPRATIVNLGMLAANVLLVTVFFKELRISAFDPALATSLGIHARTIHYVLMAVTAATVVAAFESVGVILVVAMLIAPAATAHLLTDRLGRLIAIAMLVAAASAVVGHAMAISLPAPIFGRLGFDGVRDASTVGMMALSCGFAFLAAMLFAPRHGLVSRAVMRMLLGLHVACDDALGALYRFEERAAGAGALPTARDVRMASELGVVRGWLVLRILGRQAFIECQPAGLRLTPAGRIRSEQLVRGHRLWESYLSQHFQLPEDHLHHVAHRVEHFLGPEMRRELAEQLADATQDPHGQHIPPEPESQPPARHESRSG
jgi:manganese/zinc/iron transport system permease protein